IEAMATGTTSVTAVGGMTTKISAARLATRAGCGVFIASGAEDDVLTRIFSGHHPGTFFVPNGLPLEARKHWLAYYQRPQARIEIDAKAVTALTAKGSSLLAVGVTGCTGLFAAGDIVDIAGPEGGVVARGKVRYANADIPRIAGLAS